MVDRTVKVMWDHDAFPLWMDVGRIGQTSSSRVPIPEPLKHELQAWSDEMTALMWGPNGPDAPGWDGPDRDDLERLNAAGWHLALLVRKALDQSWKVIYFDELKDLEVEVNGRA